MSRSISIFGLGYVGCVTAACLAEKGRRILGVDTNEEKVAALDAGRSPVVEPGLAELVATNNKACRLHATVDAATAVLGTDISFVCVGTPSLRNGKLDLGHISSVCTQIGQALARKDKFHLVVLRSTAIPGTAESIAIPALEQASGKRFGKDFGVCVNPEFMREGTAITDFLNPTLTVIGAAEPGHAAYLRELYSWVPGTVFETTFGVAEMVKYVCNAWHATKVAFANEIGTFCKQAGVDPEVVTEVFCADTKLNISPAYLKPGFAFGGSCLPKDLRAVIYRAKQLDLHLPLLEAIAPSNQQHLERASDLVLRTGKKNISLLGLSFKAATDDLRESPQVHLAKKLLAEGCRLHIWDDNVAMGRLIGSNRHYIDEMIPHIGCLLSSDLKHVLQDAEVVVVATRAVGSEQLRGYLRPEQVVIDLVNLESARRLDAQVAYEGICW